MWTIGGVGNPASFSPPRPEVLDFPPDAAEDLDVLFRPPLVPPEVEGTGVCRSDCLMAACTISARLTDGSLKI